MLDVLGSSYTFNENIKKLNRRHDVVRLNHLDYLCFLFRFFLHIFLFPALHSLAVEIAFLSLSHRLSLSLCLLRSSIFVHVFSYSDAASVCGAFVSITLYFVSHTILPIHKWTHTAPILTQLLLNCNRMPPTSRPNA